jgi:integrase/recombinase XerD
MKTIINGQVTLSQPLEGPLAPHIASFAKWMSEQGYSSYSLQRQVRLASDFSRWLEQNGVTLRDVSSGHPGQYLRHRARKVRIGKGDAPALRYLMAFLRRAEAIAADEGAPTATTPVECCVEEFEQYLQEERALATATIVNYLPFIRELLTHRFGNSEVQLRGCEFIGKRSMAPLF